MNSGQRAVIAAIVIAINSKSSITTIYSFEISHHISLSGSVNEKSISAYDYGRSCHINGSASSPNNFSLYDYGVSSHVNLKIDGDRFSGYDYNSGYHFSGMVRSKNVSFYDYQTCTNYNFTS